MSSAERINTLIGLFPDPRSGKELGAAARVRHDAASAQVQVELGFAVADTQGYAAALRDYLGQAGVDDVTLSVSAKVAAHQVQNGLKPLAGVSNIVAVASAKGGVGKSTTAANLALALAADGASVGVLDADIYGPSQPKLFGLSGKPDSPDGKSIVAMQAHGCKVMSIGFMVDDDTPVVWRGPMVTGALQQLLTDTQWGQLDYLIIDLPPGTGDIQLTLSQKIPVSGSVVVTTPQDLALLDARKGVKMFEKVNIPVLGVVENMSLHICSQCGHSEAIFGEGGAEKMATDFGVELLGKMPLAMDIRANADAGTPSVVADPDSEYALAYRKVARSLAINLAAQAKDFAGRFPKIVVE